jgi:hypothetical protein
MSERLFAIAETRFANFDQELIPMNYHLNCQLHTFALLCIVDTISIIEQEQKQKCDYQQRNCGYFVHRDYCIPAYLIRVELN